MESHDNCKLALSVTRDMVHTWTLNHFLRRWRKFRATLFRVKVSKVLATWWHKTERCVLSGIGFAVSVSRTVVHGPGSPEIVMQGF